MGSQRGSDVAKSWQRCAKEVGSELMTGGAFTHWELRGSGALRCRDLNDAHAPPPVSNKTAHTPYDLAAPSYRVWIVFWLVSEER